MLRERRIHVPEGITDQYALKQYVHRVMGNEERTFLFGVDPTRSPTMVVIRQENGLGEPVRMAENGKLFHFVLRTSVMKKIHVTETKTKIIPAPFQELLEIFNRRAENCGFKPMGGILVEPKQARCTRQGQKVPLNPVVYTGRLLVTDAERLNRVLQHGFPDHHKAFGFGLMQLI